MLINKAELVCMGIDANHFPKDHLPEIILLGRSNVGKSSFINSMVQRKNLAYTSSTPGKTQTLNFYNINDLLYFVDVPGYGYAQVSQKKREEFGKMIENYLTKRKELKLAILLVDFRHKPTEDDCLMYNYLKYYHIKTLIVGTKADKVGKTLYIRHEKRLKETLNLSPNDLFLKYSSVTSLGRDDAWNVIMDVIKPI
ncbi:MAG TPA: ribosome biogenesis GTP-binding protein YihA/YsxC [Haloplasmataceae bacterium]